MMSKSYRLAQVGLLCTSLVVSLLLIEVVSRWLIPSNPFNCTFAMYPHRKRLLRVTKQGETKTITHSTNRWGLRGDEPPEPWNSFYTILTVGGSTTQCYYLDDHDTWPYRLQEELRRFNPRVWVGNAGLDGHTTYGHLELMKQVVSVIKPKAIVVLVGVNDAALALHPAKPYVYDDPGRWTWRLYRQSRVAQTLYAWYLILAKHAHHVKDNPLAYIPTKIHDAVPAPSARDLEKPLELYQDHLKEMIHRARAMQSEIFFLTQPILWEDTPFWEAHEGSFYWVDDPTKLYSGAACAQVIHLYNKTLLDVCREEHIACYDLAGAIPHTEEYFYDSFHFNERGASRVAHCVAQFLKDKLPQS